MAWTDRLTRPLLALVVGAAFGASAKAEESAEPSFSRDIAPFLETHCNGCHSGSEPEAKLGLDVYRDSANVQQDFGVWERVLLMLEGRQMPPSDQEQPSEQELQDVMRAIHAELDRFDCSGERHPGRVTLRRLNRAEYNNTVRDLLGVRFRPADDFPSDDVGNGFDNIADVLTLPPVLMEKYLTAAERIADDVFASEELRGRLLTHEPAGAPESVRANIADFVFRAWRRPVTDAELDRLVTLHNSATSGEGGGRRRARQGDRQGGSGGQRQNGMRLVVQAALISPHFLFRVESDPEPGDEDGIRELNDFEIATRLSYFLWSSMPDEALFDVARRGELTKVDVLEEQVVRMLRDDKSRALVDNFAGQWLQLRDVATIAPDPERFPAFDAGLRAAALRETQMFVENIIREDRSVLEFLTADFSYVNGRLAQHYGIPGVEGEEFVKVSLPEGRRGVLTQASILTLTSNPTRTSPVKRGKWIMDNILGEPPPPPPAGIEPLDEEADLLGTLRERMEQHRSNPSCSVCHFQMDSLGFGLENFDAIGAYRALDGRFAIDPSGTLPGGAEFADAGELMDVLAERKREAFSRCLTEKLLTYAIGRGLVSYDRCAVKAITKRLADHEYRMSALVTGIVLSDPFLLREAKGDP
ncbi:MAG: DUF1592 domain-containing protein [Planctomyces sp.]|nr:DUF1592 domain-containing protein [Planctomyces sp.]